MVLKCVGRTVRVKFTFTKLRQTLKTEGNRHIGRPKKGWKTLGVRNRHDAEPIRVHDDEENYELTNFRECVRFTNQF